MGAESGTSGEHQLDVLTDTAGATLQGCVPFPPRPDYRGYQEDKHMKHERFDVPDPDADTRITELHCWIAIYPNGGEGIVSTDIELAWGVRHTPLMSGRRDLAEKLGEIAQRTLGDLKLELRTFRVVR